MPARGVFSVLEGMPHNKTHNYIGGVGPIDPGPYGNMTNNLSPVDPIFFLHHSNMDRLWDVWTRKQKSLGLPYLPTGSDLVNYSREPFLFFSDVDGKYITDGKAGDYISMDRWDYEYEPGFGEAVVGAGPGITKKLYPVPPMMRGPITKNSATLSVSKAMLADHLAENGGTSLIAEVTVTRPDERSILREFDVIVGAPEGVTEVSADSPYYAGTVAFFGKMPAMAAMHGTTQEVTFAVPLPKKPETFRGAEGVANPTISVRIVPSQKSVKAALMLRSVTLKAR